MKIRTKINLGYGLFFILILCVGAIGLWANLNILEQIELKNASFRQMVTVAQLSTELSYHAKNAEASLVQFLCLNDDMDRKSFFLHVKQLDMHLSALKNRELDPEGLEIVQRLSTEKDKLLEKGNQLLADYNDEVKRTGIYIPRNFKVQIQSFHDISSDIRNQGVSFTQYITKTLNRQAAITAISEIVSYITRAKGHLMLYLILGSEADRNKFFDRLVSLEEQIRIFEYYTSDPDIKQVAKELYKKKEGFALQGETLLTYYDQDIRDRGLFPFEDHRQAIREFWEAALNFSQDVIDIGKRHDALKQSSMVTLAKSAQFFKILIYVGLIVSLLLAFVLGNMISKKLSTPFMQLQNAFDKIAGGQLNITLNNAANDETRTLTDSFNAMAIELKNYAAQLEDRNQKLKMEIEARKQTQADLEKAFNELKILRGLLPICSHCKEIRDDKGVWNKLEAYIGQHSEAEFTHSICPKCLDRLYPETDDD
ncbi:MAG: methyl-accepting chemotaxis protein [Proteobacteria bacterium]|nr:methyl-accepting chemotaxis protein [Pseudomonadota bacterium]